jgi:hypothetical protein
MKRHSETGSRWRDSGVIKKYTLAILDARRIFTAPPPWAVAGR